MAEKQRTNSRLVVPRMYDSDEEDRAVQRERQALAATRVHLPGCPNAPYQQNTLEHFLSARNSPQQVGASTQPNSFSALPMSPQQVEVTVLPNRPSSTGTAVVNAVATATQSKSVRASNKLSHKALADVLMRERHDNSEFRCRQCDNQAKCFIDTVCHFFEAGRDKNIAAERLDMARAAYEFYIEQLDGLVKQHWVMNRATCSKCGLEREPRN